MNTKRFLVSLITFLVASSVILTSQTSGTPDILRVRVDANNSLVTAAVNQVGSVTQTVFSNARLSVDSNFNLLTVLSGGIPSGAFPLLAPNGTSAAPSYSFTNSTGTGMFLDAAGQIGFSSAGSIRAWLSNSVNTFSLPSGWTFAWSSSGNADAGNDTTIGRVSAANIQVGNGDATGTVTAAKHLSTSATGGVGYAVGAGSTVTQLTSRTTGVTINTPTGAITMFSAAGSATAATFTVTNSSVAAVDTIILNEKSGTNLYEFFVTTVAAGSFNITFFTTGGVATDAPVINYAIVKGSAS